MNSMNNLSLNSFFIFCLVLGISACKTSGDLRSRNHAYKDPIVTEENPNINSAQSPQAVDELERELAVTRGKLAENDELFRREKLTLEERIHALEAQNQNLIEQLAQIQSSTPTANQGSIENSTSSGSFQLLWNKALEDISQQQFASAESLFEEMIKNNPKSNRIFYASLGLAFSQYAQQNYKAAALSFNDIIDKFPKQKKLSLAWFGQGASFDQMGQFKDSRLFYNECSRSAPQSKEAKIALLILSKKAKAPKDLFATFPSWNSP